MWLRPRLTQPSFFHGKPINSYECPREHRSSSLAGKFLHNMHPGCKWTLTRWELFSRVLRINKRRGKRNKWGQGKTIICNFFESESKVTVKGRAYVWCLSLTCWRGWHWRKKLFDMIQESVKRFTFQSICVMLIILWWLRANLVI